jgi:protein TonB
MVSEAQGAVRKQDYAAARRWVTEAKEIGVDAASLSGVESDIQTALATTRATSASAAAAATPPPAPPQLKLVHYVEPTYPLRRLMDRVKGSVNVQFTVNAKGVTTDVKVLSSQPAGVFDRAAVDAVSRWRYQPPVQKDGQPTQVQTQIRLVFEPGPG